MSKKFIIIVISSTLGLLLVSLLGYYFIIQNDNSNSPGIVNTIRQFIPFGGDNYVVENPTNNEGENSNEEPGIPTENFTQKIRKISSEPVSGAGLQDISAGSVLRYIEKATGHIYEVELFSPNRNRISNTTIPVVYDAIWGNNNNSIITRYLSSDVIVDTYSINITSTSTDNTISGIVFPEGITDVSVLGNSVFYLQEGFDGGTGYISNFPGTNRKVVWSSPLKELTSQYINSNTVTLTTKPYPNVSGFMYSINTSNGSLTKILGDIVGLSTNTSPTGNFVFYLEQDSGSRTFVFNNKSKESVLVTPTTFPEKCVWSKEEEGIIFCAVPKEFLNGTSLTYWYLGFLSFEDSIWKYDTINNTASIVVDLTKEAGEKIDVIKPILSPNENYLVFINKIDNSLWSLDLTQQ